MAILSKKVMNFAYGMGAAVVIVGALFKITHYELGPLTGTVMLSVGLLTEALIFALSAFEPVEEELDWSLVYPELAGGTSKGSTQKKEDPQGLLSKKLDEMLKDARIDSELFSSLGASIKNFEGAAKSISPAVDAMASQKKYAEEMSVAANQMETLNGLYKIQLDSAKRNTDANAEIADNATRLKEQMASMTSNIASLNNVYGGMLSAMSNSK